MCARKSGWCFSAFARFVFSSCTSCGEPPARLPFPILVGWMLMTFLCFAPVQVENFLYGIEIETFFPGFALLAAAAINLSGSRFRRKTLANLALAFIATYTFANGMLVWALAWPLPAPNEPAARQRRFIWSSIYAAGRSNFGGRLFYRLSSSFLPSGVRFDQRAISRSCSLHCALEWELFFHRLRLPVSSRNHRFDAVFQRRWFRDLDDLAARRLANVLSLAAVGSVRLRLRSRSRLSGEFGFGVEQALDNRYLAFSRFLYIALFGLFFALYCARVRTASAARRTFFLTNAGWTLGLLALCWATSYPKNLAVLAEHHQTRARLLRALEWMEPIPDNPDLVLILPFVEPLRNRARFLAEKGVLRLAFVHDPLASAVKQSPPPADGSHGEMSLPNWRRTDSSAYRLGLVAGTKPPGGLRRDRSREQRGNFKPIDGARNWRRAAGSATMERRPDVYRAGSVANA